MKQLSITSLLLLLSLQFYSRFAAAPVADFTVDDWPILERSGAVASYADAIALMAKDPDRPISAGVMTILFRAFGDHPESWALFSVAIYSVLLVLLIALARRLDRAPAFTLLTATVFALVPNLTESFSWPTMIAYAGGLAAYVASALLWVRFLQGDGAITATLSGALLLFGLGTYEVGIGLPAAYVMLTTSGKRRRQLAGLAPCLAAVAVYLGWKFSHGFGLAHGVLFVPRSISVTPDAVLWNAKETASWWIGENMCSTISSGWNTFLTMDKWPWRLFFAGNVFAALLAASAIAHAQHSEPDTAAIRPSFTPRQVLLFGATWFAVTAGISLVSWAGGRLNIMPAIGLAIVFAAVLADRPSRAFVPVFTLIAVVCLGANQGTAVAWRDSGRFHRQLYTSIRAQEPAWRNAEVVLFDTAALRQRLTPGLLRPVGQDVTTWAFYGNAGLLRGFSPETMLKMAAREGETLPTSVLDVENGARWEQDVLTWHERWNPAKPHATGRDKVYVVDCFSAGATTAK